ncbi:MAG: prephenate dehydratase [Clostridiales bacterium]|nr:prephenate dehydratase [Clostridiales bacterium]
MDLLDLRKEIDDIDEKLIPLLLKRMSISEKVAEYKVKRGIPVLNEQREKEILDEVHKKCGKNGDTIATVFAATMDASRALQHKITGGGKELRELIENSECDENIFFGKTTVACAGVAGSYAAEAALNVFPNADLIHYKLFEDVFEAVNKNETPFGIIPVENSTAGSVHESYDLIMKYKFYVIAAYSLEVNHCLCAKPETEYKDIVNVYSHPQALAQCSEFLRNFDFTGVNYTNTAAAAKFVSESKNKNIAAVCSADAAKKYGLKILKSNIQNINNNFTRFLVVSKKLLIEKGANKITIIFSVPHTTGSLYRVLGRFSMAGLNLTKIESRPTENGDFNYYFYTDFLGNINDTKTLDLLCALSSELPNFKFLGNYHEY